MQYNHPNQEVLKGRDIVVVTIQPWYFELGSNCKNIATQFSKYNRVLYVNIPITKKTYFSGNKSKGIAHHCDIIKNRKPTIERINDNMWNLYPTTLIESINWLPSTGLFRFFNRINNKRFAKDILKAIQQLGFKDIILFNDNDIYNGFYLDEIISPSLYVYYCRDFLQAYAFWKKHTSVLEPELIKKSRAVVANSTYYAEYWSSFNPSSKYIGQGCNIELFDKSNAIGEPKELANIPFPRIGYVGSLDSTRLDHEILRTIALENPDWNIILVGPEDEAFAQSDLHSFKNIHFLGRRDLSQLPLFVNAFDVCLNPQLINMATTGNYPLKIDEYLAMGKPVVATRTKTMKLFENHTYLADTPAGYSALIRKALEENNETKIEERIRFARTHTWENSMIMLYDAIKPFVQSKL